MHWAPWTRYCLSCQDAQRRPMAPSPIGCRELVRLQSHRHIGREDAMLLVSRTEGRSCTVLSIDGRLSGRSIGVVEGFCDRAISTGRQVRLILHDVTTVDQAGNAMLCRLVARGVHLRGNGTGASHPAKALDRTGTEPLNCSLDAGKPGGGRTRRTV